MNLALATNVWPPAGGEMALRVRDTDWSASPLGAVGTWPASLRIAVYAVMDSPLPAVLLWGEDLLQIYNDDYAQTLGLRHPAALGQPTRECWPEVWDFNEPVYRRVLDTGERIFLEDQEYVIQPSGVRELRYFTVSYVPARDEAGTVRGVHVQASETTRRVRAELENQKLLKTARLSADQLGQMFRQAPSFIALLRGPDHVFEIANAAYMRLVDRPVVIGQAVRQAFPEAGSQGYLALLDGVLASGEAFTAAEMPCLLENPEGGPPVLHFLDFVYQPIKNSEGRVEGIFVEGCDVTEKRRVKEALADLSRRKDDFLAMLAHELRNPLAPIMMAAKILAHPETGASSVREMSGVVMRQAGQMNALVEDLLDVSRITKGLVTLDCQPIVVNDMVLNAVEQVRALMETRRQRLVTRLPAEAPLISGDRGRMIQVFSNILNNAAKYTQEAGEIVLAVTVENGQVRVNVRDNGAGISPGLLPYIFEIFTQAERSADRVQGGLGLGLALVKNLVELQGGTVSAKSDGAGRGSEFEVCFPLIEPAAVQVPPPPALAAPLARPLRIMVVDDNVDSAATVGILLEMDGHSVVIEHTGEGALYSAQAFCPEVCLLDIGLPDLDGYQLAVRLRVLGETAGALLIAMTGYDQPQDRELSKQAGIDHHMVKPIDLKALEDLLKAYAVRTGPAQAEPLRA